MSSPFSKYMKTPDPDKAHARLSASGADRWLGCPGSVRLSEGIPSVDNDASKRGTHTHTLLQFMLENADWPTLLAGLDSKRFRDFIEFDQAMLENARFASLFVGTRRRQMFQATGVMPKLLVEQKLKLEDVGFGTADIVLYQPFGALHVMDYKNGKKAVEPENNWQGLYYAHAAADLFGWDFSQLYITIIQPNAKNSRGPIRTWKTDYKTLTMAGDRLKRGAALTKKPNAPLVKNDSWCWFCPARDSCPAHAEKRMEKVREMFKR